MAKGSARLATAGTWTGMAEIPKLVFGEGGDRTIMIEGRKVGYNFHGEKFLGRLTRSVAVSESSYFEAESGGESVGGQAYALRFHN